MANYVLGFGDKCCTDCTPNDACKATPVINPGSTTPCVGSFFSFSGSWGTNTPTSRTITGLPPGISYNTETNVVSGTPTTPGTTACAVTATNACGTGTGTFSFIIGERPTITSALTATAVYGSPFSYFITATPTPSGYTASGLPPGFYVNTATGEISSTNVTWRGSYAVTIGAELGLCPGYATLVITSDCLDPTLVADAVAASKSKCGNGENAGHESTPPKIYLKREWSGAIGDHEQEPYCGVDVGYSETTWGGYCEYSRSTCTTSGDMTVNGVGLGSCSAAFTAQSVCPAPYDGTHTITATTITVVGNNTCYQNHRFYGTATETLSNEFTTAQLISDTQAAMPSFPGTWEDSPVTIRDLDSDELTYSEQQSQYKFMLPSMAGFTSYAIAWVERFTPTGGGGPTDTARSYTWNGVASETGVYSLPVPASNGMTTIASIVITCS